MFFCKRLPEGIQYIKVLHPHVTSQHPHLLEPAKWGNPQAEEEMSKTAREVELRLHSSGEASAGQRKGRSPHFLRHFGDGGYHFLAICEQKRGVPSC